MEGGGLGLGEDVAVGGEADGGGHVLGEGELAEVFLGVDEAFDGAGDANGFIAESRKAGDYVALGVEVHVAGGGEGGALAEVEEVGFAMGGADHHEAAATEVPGAGPDDGESEAYGYGGVDGVAALLEDGEAGVGGFVMDGDYGGVAFGGRGGERGAEEGRREERGDGLRG